MKGSYFKFFSNGQTFTSFEDKKMYFYFPTVFVKNEFQWRFYQYMQYWFERKLNDLNNQLIII
jgi:hypothetical protein